MTARNQTVRSREVRLASRPVGEPADANFELATVDVGPAGEGEILVKNTLMSVEPYMRGRMNDTKSYVPPFEIGKPLDGAAIGTVVASNAPEIPAGATVLHNSGWREYAVVPAKAARAIDTSRVPADVYLGALGGPGFTAWVGLRIIAEVKAGETIFVSGAAGAVGSMAVQLAKRWGLRVIGSASSPEKARAVREEFGADAAFDYHDGPTKQLRELAPDGIDVYFDNVGGEQLEAAIFATRTFARIVMCGAVSQYNAASLPPGPRNLALAIGRRLRLQGFIVIDHFGRRDEFIAEVAPLIASGEIKSQSTFSDGLENAPAALMNILRPNTNIGKAVVRLG
ncbi:MAG TPA: NADP-dependent oxidoreductase [Candidatus Limnocylindrales bacterium]|nr:NADP-dependent oxidoreductase [Candidatus Limnocylindrales bacterium]